MIMCEVQKETYTVSIGVACNKLANSHTSGKCIQFHSNLTKKYQ